jgi:hypothetical protein
MLARACFGERCAVQRLNKDSSKIRVARRSLRSGLREVGHGETQASLFALLQGPLGPLPKKLTSLMPSHQTKIPTLANVPKHPSRSLLT